MTIYAGSSVDYLSAAETATLVRLALRDAFPATRFSVRSKTYSGGASINVGWTDGPSNDAVDAVVGPFAGSDFDGMIDLKVSVRALVASDGRIVGHDSSGTEGSHGTIPAVHDDVPGARMVHFGADYVFTNREISADADKAIDAIVAFRFGDDPYYGAKWRTTRTLDLPVDVDRYIANARAFDLLVG